MIIIKGLLVTNHFLTSEKFNTLHRHLIESAEKSGIELLHKTNLELACESSFDCEFALFWDKDTTLAKRIENSGIRSFNSSRAIELCDNKAKTYTALDGKIKMPKTIPAPLTYFKSDLSDFVSRAVEILGLPIVFKECFGSFGEQVYLCKSVDEINQKLSEKPFILQEYISSSKGKDIRIEVVGGKAVCAMRRKNECDFRSNITNGGTAEAYSPSPEEERIAVEACRILGLDFGGVDILDGGFLCEVNSNAHIINIMNTTKTDIAPLIFEYIKEEIK